MSLVRVHNFSVSLDGFSAGADQSLEAPFGHAGQRLVRSFMDTRSFHVMTGQEGGSTGIDDAFASNWGPGIGVEIMGRNKFGPQRGPWTDEEWKGWWGEEPPFHTPVFVLTHHVRPSIEMKGGTTFHFIDASPAQALAAAREAAGGLDVRIGGGPSTVRQFLAADLVDFMHLVIVPITLGRGTGGTRARARIRARGQVAQRRVDPAERAVSLLELLEREVRPAVVDHHLQRLTDGRRPYPPCDRDPPGLLGELPPFKRDQRDTRGRGVLGHGRIASVQRDLCLPAVRTQLSHHGKRLPLVGHRLGPAIAPAQVDGDRHARRQERRDQERDQERFVPGRRSVAALHTAGQHERIRRAHGSSPTSRGGRDPGDAALRALRARSRTQPAGSNTAIYRKRRSLPTV